MCCLEGIKVPPLQFLFYSSHSCPKNQIVTDNACLFGILSKKTEDKEARKSWCWGSTHDQMQYISSKTYILLKIASQNLGTQCHATATTLFLNSTPELDSRFYNVNLNDSLIDCFAQKHSGLQH